MPLKMSVADALQIDALAWKARLPSNELKVFGAPVISRGAVSIALLSEPPSFEARTGNLSFNPGSLLLLNLGSSDQIVFVHSSLQNAPKDSRFSAGDAMFVDALPTNLRELGVRLLQDVRKKCPGELKYYAKSGKYVEEHDNFWTVRIQPRDGSLRITVRGKPSIFQRVRSLALKPDMHGYSSFKLSDMGQMQEALMVLNQAIRK